MHNEDFDFNKYKNAYIDDMTCNTHRYYSFDIFRSYLQSTCSNLFQEKSRIEYVKTDELISDDKQVEITALHLGFFMASWGMFRNKNLMAKNLEFFKKAVWLIFSGSSEFDKRLWSISLFDFAPNSSRNKEAKDIFNHCCDFLRNLLNEDEKNKWSETFVTKILLGIWGQCPALDLNFCTGYRKYRDLPVYATVKANGELLETLASKSEEEEWDLSYKSNFCDGIEYPPGKVIDMAFFEYGKILLKK